MKKKIFYLDHLKLKGVVFNNFLDATTHLYKRLCRSVGPSVGPVLFANDKKRLLLCSNDNEI